MKKLFVILFSALLMSFTAYAAIDVFEFDNEQQEEQFKELSHTLRCPKCQNNTISDSNAELAKDLRVKVYEMTKAGKSKDEIVDYMIARYGNFVTYKPPFTIATSVLWLGPLFVVLLGFSIIVFNSKKKAQKVNQSKEWDAEKEARLKAILEENGDKQ
ncbi:cytochrome c-type biogenesis protein [Vibrio sp. VB16]|jgi:cytochrome c-type biogenesis protein CcmH|uniref:cytochrome c-type biogenesis protein n=1 Tax=Vibrio sp. VB16 TaxID=2785746 RepID=UPI00189C972C|nr:cytochrome c-type biogenesis protein [Vibrio sp. VB16]UGA53976.1 cytochrome c-type biogenesis protein CcmH [Vibrio sp. VB16]